MEFIDYYKILGLPKTATTDEIKKTYRKLARQYHPDVNPGDKSAEERFKQMSEAFDILSDPKKRAVSYEKAQEIFKRERPWMTIAHSTIYIPMAREVEGFIMAPNGSVSFENVYVRD